MKKLTVLIIVLLSLALTLTACGKAGPRSATLNVIMDNMVYAETAYTVPAGAVVTLNANNKDAVEHEFVIMKKGMTVVAPWGDKDEDNIFWELDAVAAGTKKTGTFTAPTEPGEYEVVCGNPGHIEKGMVGKLIVTAP